MCNNEAFNELEITLNYCSKPGSEAVVIYNSILYWATY